MTVITNEDKTIDIRKVIARVEELREARDTYDDFHNTPGAWAAMDDGEAEELADLEALLEECKGNGGDEEWEGAWYPLTLIRYDHIEDYARELVKDCGLCGDLDAWPATCIDWERAASELTQDYTLVTYGDQDYYTR